MKELWRKTTKLFLNYPVLWLPYVCARLLNDLLDSLWHAVPIFRWLTTTTHRSVLGGAPVQVHSAAASSRLWLFSVIELSLRYPNLCLDTVAIVVTAALVAMIVRGEQPRLRAALAELRAYPKRILGYSFKLYLLELVFATFVSYPALRLMNRMGRVANYALLEGQFLVGLVLIAWIITPITIRLLRVPGAEPPSADEKRRGRYFIILTGIGAFALSAALFPPLFKLVALRPSPEYVYASLVSLVLSFPVLLGDIAVALIAAGGEWKAGETAVQRKWRHLVRVLMPLHLGEREEH